ncbi:MAG: NAD(P)/FAD-dependent oxidoreductase [Candidatus Diapherotrites archaeon]
MEKYDVAIVGAGPGGLMAALKLAEKGVSVICFDKKQEIGVPVRCAEGLGGAAFERLGIEPDPAWASWGIKGAALYSPSGKKIEVTSKETVGFVLERRIFEKWIARKAANAGAKIFVKSHVKEIERKDNGVELIVNQHGEEKKFFANIVIAADGVDSIIARKMGINTTGKLIDVDSGFQYEMAGIDFEGPDRIHLYFGNDIAPRGYCWLFPKGEHEANVGIGIGGTVQETAREYLDKWIASMEGLKKGSIIHVNAGAIPVGGFLEDMTGDNLVVVGDAAHQVNPVHGGGIALAMQAAQIAAGVVAEAVEKKDYSHDSLKAYNKLWYDAKGNSLKKILKIRQMLEEITDNEFESLVDKISSEDVMKLARGELATGVKITAKLITDPGLVKKMLKHLK